MHVPAPAAEYFPAVQSEQEPIALPAHAVEYFPAMQRVHTEESAADHDPGGHAQQAGVPVYPQKQLGNDMVLLAELSAA